MADPLSLLESVRGSEPRVALATLVATKGSVPRGDGAKMCVGASGRVLGTVTIGGCVDGRVVDEAGEVLAEGRARRLVMELGDEDAWALGLTCGGSIELLVEPVDPDRVDDPVVYAGARLRELATRGDEAVCVARLDGVPGRLVVGEDGTVAGTLGDATLDAAAAEVAREALRAATSRLARAADATGMSVELFAERYAPPATLVVFGASQVAQALVEIAATLGWRIAVADAREQWATAERFPRAHDIYVGMLGEVARTLRYGPRTAVVLVAHDYRFELPVLRAVLASGAGYVGLLGSRRRGAGLLDVLREEGMDPALLERVRVPVGLDLGASTPAEIALAIAAEALAVLRGREGGALRARAARALA